MGNPSPLVAIRPEKHIEGALEYVGPASSAIDAIRHAIFIYVGAEVSIGTKVALLPRDGGIRAISLQQAGYFVRLYWGTGGALCLFVFAIWGPVAGYAALAIGLFNSIMFPTIFTLTLERSRAS